MIAEKLRPMWIWLLVNVAGVVIYLAIGAWIKAPRPEGHELNGIDEIYFWMTRALPVLAVVAVFGLAWLVKLLRSQSPDRAMQLRFWISTCFVWGVVLVCDGLAVKIAKIAVLIVTGEARK